MNSPEIWRLLPLSSLENYFAYFIKIHKIMFLLKKLHLDVYKSKKKY